MKQKVIIFYPFRFRNYDYDRFEIKYLEKFFKIYIFDLLEIIHPHFNKAYTKEKYIPKNVYKFKNFNEIKKFLIINNLHTKNEKIKILNFVSSVNINSLKINILIKNLNCKIFGFYNPGNYFWKTNDLSIFNRLSFTYSQILRDTPRFIWNLKVRFFNFLNNLFNIKIDLIFVAGKEYLKSMKGKKVVEINSWDYSRLIRSKKKIKSYKKKIITFLDSPGPLFKSDSYLLKRKNDESAEKTYPSLNIFFKILEKKYKAKVVIAAHPKTKHKKKPKYFYGRKVVHGNSLELIFNSKLVVTRNSSAITYAIEYHKPLLFIYTDEILEKKNLGFYNIYFLAKELGLNALNINSKKKINNILKLNKNKYFSFKKKYFSSLNKLTTNHDIIKKELEKK